MGKKSFFFPEIRTKTDISTLKTIIDPSYIQGFSPYRVVNKQIWGYDIHLLVLNP